jgi:hypothetical protein
LTHRPAATLCATHTHPSTPSPPFLPPSPLTHIFGRLHMKLD